MAHRHEGPDLRMKPAVGHKHYGRIGVFYEPNVFDLR